MADTLHLHQRAQKGRGMTNDQRDEAIKEILWFILEGRRPAGSKRKKVKGIIDTIRKEQGNAGINGDDLFKDSGPPDRL